MKIRINTSINTNVNDNFVSYGYHPDLFEFPIEFTLPKETPTMSKDDVDRIADMARAHVALILEQLEACYVERQLQNMTKQNDVSKKDAFYANGTSVSGLSTGNIKIKYPLRPIKDPDVDPF